MAPRRLSSVQVRRRFTSRTTRSSPIFDARGCSRPPVAASRAAVRQLDLWMLTEDAQENVDENRRRLGEHVGHPWPRSATAARSTATACRRATSRPRLRGRRPRRTARRARWTTRGRSCSSPFACRSCWRRTAPLRRCTAAARRSRAGSSTRAWRSCARSAAPGPITPRSAPAPAALLRGLGRGP